MNIINRPPMVVIIPQTGYIVWQGSDRLTGHTLSLSGAAITAFRDPQAGPDAGQTAFEIFPFIDKVGTTRLMGYGFQPDQLGVACTLQLGGTHDNPQVGFSSFTPFS